MEVDHLMLARSLVNTFSDVIPLRALNPKEQPCALYKEMMAAMCEPEKLVGPQHGAHTSVAL